jgi:uncharacterized protein (TIGR02301 family)
MRAVRVLSSCRTVISASLLFLGAHGSLLPSADAATDGKPYDEKLFRLAEILGAVHYLRELCNANEGPLWRDRMKELMDAEGSSALRRARLTRSFNQGYRSYSRTYITCTPSAQTAIGRFLTEGVEISEGLVKSIP